MARKWLMLGLLALTLGCGDSKTEIPKETKTFGKDALKFRGGVKMDAGMKPDPSVAK